MKLNVAVPTEEGAKKFNIKFHPGYVGAFTSDEAEGAWPNGTRIVKSYSEPGDSTANGTKGTILGSLRNEDGGLAYFVEWDDKLRFPVLTGAIKISLAEKVQ